MSTAVLLCGADGQLGRELQLTCPAELALHAMPRSVLDITDLVSIERALDSAGARYVVNAAAYTAVDRAETDVDAARAVNSTGPALLAKACAARGVRLLHVSTDFVFDGAVGEPYRPESATAPLGIYGQTKRDGELAVLGSGADALIVRTGWVYSRHGSNFVKTMVRLMAERQRLTVVEDQVGTPTWARGLAQVSWALLTHPDAFGVYHWSDAGVCSWYDFAWAIREQCLERGILRTAAQIDPIPASDYATPARRPSYSVLDKSATRSLTGITGQPWSDSLRAMLADWQATGDLAL